MCVLCCYYYYYFNFQLLLHFFLHKKYTRRGAGWWRGAYIHTIKNIKLRRKQVSKLFEYKKQQNKTKSLFCVEYAFDYFSSMINNNITSFDRQTDRQSRYIFMNKSVYGRSCCVLNVCLSIGLLYVKKPTTYNTNCCHIVDELLYADDIW